jgi:hypothetical protein
VLHDGGRRHHGRACTKLAPTGWGDSRGDGGGARRRDRGTIAVASALACLTPIGYWSNTKVYRPGGYRIADYLRLGLPLTIIAYLGIIIVFSLRWPL